ncbi:hypothetical protein [Streptomyces sp. NPDC048560]|uniref:hypothetical protein n=1 Tax=Streptomyces sp. NPDC048560 TaxID=3155488 RepID=UPI0034499B79
MTDLFGLLGDLWSDAFSWLVYPLRIVALVVASAVVLRVVLHRVLPALHGVADWAGAKLSRLLGSVLLAPEYGCTLLLVRADRGIPLPLRLYGRWVENVTDWVTSAGGGVGKAMRACSRASYKVVGALLLVYLAGYNMHVIGGADDPVREEAPVVAWWDSFQVWLENPEHPVLEDSAEVTGPAVATPDE